MNNTNVEGNVGYLYRDSTDKQISLQRKRDFRFSIILQSAFYIFILLFWISAIFLNIGQSYFSLLVISFFILLVAGIFIIFLYNIRTHKKILEEGISLNHEYLNLYGEKIKVKDILYAEVVSFTGSGGIKSIKNPNTDKMLVIFIKNKRGKIKDRIIRYDETKDISKLSNLIRGLIGLPEQREIKEYGLYRGYYVWKKEIMEAVNGKREV